MLQIEEVIGPTEKPGVLGFPVQFELYSTAI